MCVHNTSKYEVTIVISELKQRLVWTFRTYSCDRNSKECMIHCCESCPGVNAVKKIIEGELMKVDDDGQVEDYDDVEITFQ